MNKQAEMKTNGGATPRITDTPQALTLAGYGPGVRELGGTRFLVDGYVCGDERFTGEEFNFTGGGFNFTAEEVTRELERRIRASEDIKRDYRNLRGEE